MLRIFRRDRDENSKQTSEAVQPSRQRWFGRILGVLRSSRLNEEVWEELEEILISSDVGVDTSIRIIQEVRDQVKREEVEDPDQVFQYLKDSLIAELELEGRGPTVAGYGAGGNPLRHPDGRRQRRGQDHQHRQAGPTLHQGWQTRHSGSGGHLPCRRH